MKISKYIFIFTVSLCLSAHGMTLYQICVGPDHCDSDIEWASNCHTQNSDSHNSHKSSFGHQDNECIDISISSIAISGGSNTNNNQYIITKPIILKPAASDHPFAPIDFSRLKTNLFPVFTDTTTLSLASTILIV
jgi:hypothetical protein